MEKSEELLNRWQNRNKIRDWLKNDDKLNLMVPTPIGWLTFIINIDNNGYNKVYLGSIISDNGYERTTDLCYTAGNKGKTIHQIKIDLLLEYFSVIAKEYEFLFPLLGAEDEPTIINNN